MTKPRNSKFLSITAVEESTFVSTPEQTTKPDTTTVPATTEMTTEPTTIPDTTVAETTPEPTTEKTTIIDSTPAESTAVSTAEQTTEAELTTLLTTIETTHESTTKEATTIPPTSMPLSTTIITTDATATSTSLDTSMAISTSSPASTISSIVTVTDSTAQEDTNAPTTSSSQTTSTSDTSASTTIASDASTVKASTSISVPTTAATTGIQTSTKDVADEITATTKGVSSEVSMVPASTLYGVAGGLSAALLIAILVIAYLLWERMKKNKDDKESLIDEDPEDSESHTDSHVYQNGAYTEENEISGKETGDDYDTAVLVAAGDELVTDLDAPSENSPSEKDMDPGGSINGSTMEDQEPKPPAPDEELNPEETESALEGGDYGTHLNDFDFDEPNAFQAELQVAAAAAAAAFAARSPETSEHEPVHSPDYGPPTIILSDEIVEEQETIKEDAITSVKVVTLKGFGDEKEDVKAVLRSMELMFATSADSQNVKRKIAIMEQLSDIDRPNILKYYGSYEKEDVLSYANAYAENGSLYQALRGGQQMNANTLMLIIAGIGKGLQYLHAKNITHGKLWSKAVMLSADNTPMLTDIEGDSGGISEYDEFMRWQAIEVIDQTSSASPAADVWSYGTLMWEIVSHGAVPYSDVTDLRDLVKRMQEQQLRRPKQCSESLFSIMETCWHKDPKLRPDMYVVNSNISEKLLEDSNEHISMELRDQDDGMITSFDDPPASRDAETDAESDADYTAF